MVLNTTPLLVLEPSIVINQLFQSFSFAHRLLESNVTGYLNVLCSLDSIVLNQVFVSLSISMKEAFVSLFEH